MNRGTMNPSTIHRATRTIVAYSSVTIGLAGLIRGLYVAGTGMAMPEIDRMGLTWFYGTEQALVNAPKMILTGKLILGISFAIIIWSAMFVHKIYSPTVFFVLFLLLFIFEAGIGLLVLSISTCLAATRINKSLTWWRTVLPENLRRLLMKLYPYSLTAVLLLSFTGLIFAVQSFHFPGVDPQPFVIFERPLLRAAAVLYMFTFVAGFAYDIQ